MYKFKVGQQVKYVENQTRVGVIVQHVSCCEDSGEVLFDLNEEDPWYLIKWDDGQHVYDGFESQDLLIEL